MTIWGYRYVCSDGNVIKEEFKNKKDLMDYLKRMDSQSERNIRYWYVEEQFDPTDILRDLADGVYRHLDSDDWLSDALDTISDLFADGDYDWECDDMFHVYTREEEE